MININFAKGVSSLKNKDFLTKEKNPKAEQQLRYTVLFHTILHY